MCDPFELDISDVTSDIGQCSQEDEEADEHHNHHSHSVSIRFQVGGI